MLTYSEIQSILADQSESLLSHRCQTINKDRLHTPSPTYVDDVFSIESQQSSLEKFTIIIQSRAFGWDWLFINFAG